MSVPELLGLAVGIYEPSLAKLRNDLRSIPEVLRIPILIIDFDTEVAMNGILGFVENSTGLYLVDTIDALTTICAHRTADTLRSVLRIMDDHGVTVERLREDLANAELFQVTSFQQLHGDELSEMADLIVREARKLYVYDPAGEVVFDLLEAYLQPRRDELIASLEACQAPGTLPP